MSEKPPQPGVSAKTGTTAKLRLPGEQLTVVLPGDLDPDERVVLRSTDEEATYRRTLSAQDARALPELDATALVFTGLPPDLAYTLVLGYAGREGEDDGHQVVFEAMPFADLKRLERGGDVEEKWGSDEPEVSDADSETLAYAGTDGADASDEQWEALLEEEGLTGEAP